MWWIIIIIIITRIILIPGSHSFLKFLTLHRRNGGLPGKDTGTGQLWSCSPPSKNVNYSETASTGCPFSNCKVIWGIHGDVELHFPCSTWYLTFLLYILVRYWVEHKKRDHISKQPCIILYIKHLTNKKKSTLFTMPFIPGTKYCEWHVSIWLAISKVKLLLFFTLGNMVFVSAGNPYKALQFIE